MNKLTAVFVFTLLTSGCSSSSNGTGTGNPPADGDSGVTQVASDSGATHTDSGTSTAEDSGTSVTEGGSSEPIGCQTSGSACTCIVSSSSNAPPPSPAGTCPGTQIPSAICCAGNGYPTADLSECQCQPAVCFDSGNDCVCATDGQGTAATCTKTYQYCCANVLNDGSINSCTCSNFACSSGTTQVQSCSAATMTCTGNEPRVTACR
jgi:hypothetical protein